MIKFVEFPFAADCRTIPIYAAPSWAFRLPQAENLFVCRCSAVRLKTSLSVLFKAQRLSFFARWILKILDKGRNYKENR